MIHNSPAEPGVFENLRLELRRGSIVLAVLAELRSEHYGYALRATLAQSGMAVEENTLYPLLRRLESQGLLTSEWREHEQRNKRFYRLSREGRTVLKALSEEWERINSTLGRILSPQARKDQPQRRKQMGHESN
jgi:PadR family transcriptional regulator PadR